MKNFTYRVPGRGGLYKKYHEIAKLRYLNLDPIFSKTKYILYCSYNANKSHQFQNH